MSNEQKIPKVMVMSANGGIGKATVEYLLEEMELNGKFVNIAMSCRDKKDLPYTKVLDAVSKEMKTLGVDYNISVGKALSRKNIVTAANEPNFVKWDTNDLAEFNQQIKDTNVLIIPGGAARKVYSDGSVPDRLDLLDKNLSMIKEMVTAAVNGGFDITKSKIILNTNPLDESTLYAEQVARDAWVAKGGSLDKLPEIIAVGMAGNLDESRYRVHLEEEINKKLAEKGSDIELISADIEAHVLATHDDNQYFNRKSIKIKLDGKNLTLNEFFSKVGVSVSASEIVDLLSKAENQSKVEGKKIVEGLGRSTQDPAGKKGAQLAAAMLWGDPHEVTACVKHTFDGVESASGARVVMSRNGVEVNQDWLAAASQDNDLVKGVKSRDQVPSNLQASLARNEARDDLATALYGTKTKITFEEVFGDEKAKKVTIELRGKSPKEVAEIQGKLDIVLRVAANDNRHKVINSRGNPPKLTVEIPNAIKMESLQDIAKSAGVSIDKATRQVG